MPLELLIKLKKPLLLLLAALVLLGSGYYYGSKNSKPQVKIETKEVIVEKVVEKKVFIEVKAKEEHEKTKIVVVKSKDGTETTTTEITKDTKEDSSITATSDKQSDKLASKETTVTPVSKKYRVGAMAVEVLPKLSTPLDFTKPDYQVMVGRRVIGDLWVDAGYQIKTNSVLLGISWEF